MTPVSSLSTEQAQRALLSLFESIPAGLWKGGVTPSSARLTNLVDKAEDQAEAQNQDDVLSAIAKLREPGGALMQGAVAKAVLADLLADPDWSPLVEQAVLAAQRPHMSPIPAELGPILLTLAALAIRIRFVRTTGGKTGPKTKLDFEFSPAHAVDATLQLIKNLPSVFLGG